MLRTDVPDAAFVTVAAIDTGGGEPVVTLSGDEVASASQSGPNQTCGQGAAPGWVAWVSREFMSRGGQTLGYERIVTYHSAVAAAAAVTANKAAASSCAQRYADDPTYKNLKVSSIRPTGLGRQDAAFVTSYTVTSGVASGKPALEYVAEITVANVYAEVVLTGERTIGLDPGPAALVNSAAAARRSLIAIYLG